MNQGSAACVHEWEYVGSSHHPDQYRCRRCDAERGADAASWQVEYRRRGIRSGWRGPVFIANAPGWFGLRWRGRRYFVLRDTRRHKALFSEREGIRPFYVLAQIGSWQLGWKR